MFFTRPDGVPADVPPLRRILPHIMPGRCGSLVYFSFEIPIAETRRFLDGYNARRDPATPPLKLFHLVVGAAAKTLHKRPGLNRFVVGRSLYERRSVDISYSIKQRWDDSGPITTRKTRFPQAPRQVQDLLGPIQDDVEHGRSDQNSVAEGEVALLARLPVPLRRVLFTAQRLLDHLNLLPGSMIATDPLYASLFIANLGSVGLTGAYHHLYEYGTISLFCTMGKVQEAVRVREDGSIGTETILPLTFTLDERIADGYYCARSLQQFEAHLRDPGAWLAE